MHRIPVLALLFAVGLAPFSRADDSQALRKMFADPPREYATAPLWVWNDMLTEEQIKSTLEDLAGQKVKQAFVHPRPGLMTPYLSDQWFGLWKVALREAERLDMNIWIYDENSYPSGFAGGHVPDQMPEARGRGLHFKVETQPGKPGPEVVGIFQLTGDKTENVTAKARNGEALPAGQYLVAEIRRARDNPWHGGRSYVDLMYPGVTEKFLQVTMEPYRKQIGDQFGKRILGAFTDEPNIRPGGGLPWTDHLPQAFEKRWGYSLADNLASLNRPVGDWKKVRHDYYQVLTEQFIEHWAKPYYEYCQKNGLAFTGHYWDHEWPNCVGVPDNMALSAWQQIPGIDCLMNQYREDTHAQFGNVRMVKEVSSLCNQLGRKRFLCETYGAGGWDLRFEDMKRIGDWLAVLGVNLFDEHLSYVTLRGARKADHPQSFSYHEPWWPDYHLVAQYLTRLSAAMSQGEQINRILVIEPTTTAWMYQGDAAKLREIGDSFFNLLMRLERAQVEYDLGCEDVMARHGSLGAKTLEAGQTLKIGQREYSCVVLPPGTDSLNEKTMNLLEEFAKAGGSVIACGPAPTMVDARGSDRGVALAKGPAWTAVEPPALAELLLKRFSGAMAIRRAADDKGNLFHQRRAFGDGQLVLLVNTSIENASSGEIEGQARTVEEWCCQTGKIKTYPSIPAGDKAKVSFTVPPCGSLLLFFSNQSSPAPAAASVAGEWRVLQPTGPMQVRRIQPNVLTIDHMDVTAGSQTKTSLYFHKANQFAFQQNGMARNPWDSAVQFKEELIARKFPADSGLSATYRFRIEGEVPKPLWIVVERPDLYAITCNGTSVSAAKGEWWLDKAFGKIDIAALAKLGENAVTLKASPMTIYHELEPAYLLGDFALRSADAGFVVTPAAPLHMKPWNEQGMPFYSAGVTYTQTIEVPQVSGKYRVALGKWLGSVARVSVNGKPAGRIAWQPFECDVTELLKPGSNTLEVTVIGTLKNTLGPHHAGPIRGSAWPSMFHKSPPAGPPAGAQYDTIGYGLFEPFVLKQQGR